MMHESSMYFERCHYAELVDGVSANDRAECWRRWLEWYAYGQEPARVLHARERLVFLSQGEALEPLPTATSDQSEPELEPTDTPAATVTAGGTVPQPHVYTPGIPPPRAYRESDVCRGTCRPRWDTCAAPCGEASNRTACLGACQADYTTCMRGCF
jgi:hypothetical protein